MGPAHVAPTNDRLATALQALDDALVDLVDYCMRQVTALTAATHVQRSVPLLKREQLLCRRVRECVAAAHATQQSGSPEDRDASAAAAAVAACLDAALYGGPATSHGAVSGGSGRATSEVAAWLAVLQRAAVSRGDDRPGQAPSTTGPAAPGAAASAAPGSLLPSVFAWRRDLGFSVGVSCVTLLRYVSDVLPQLPLSVQTRLLDTHDLPLALVPLIENPPWVTRGQAAAPPQAARVGGVVDSATPRLSKTTTPAAPSDPPVWLKYVGHEWVVVPPRDLMVLTPVEGQTWLALYNLLCEPEVRKRYAIHSHRRGTLSRVRKYVNEVRKDRLTTTGGNAPSESPALTLSLLRPAGSRRPGATAVVAAANARRDLNDGGTGGRQRREGARGSSRVVAAHHPPQRAWWCREDTQRLQSPEVVPPEPHPLSHPRTPDAHTLQASLLLEAVAELRDAAIREAQQPQIAAATALQESLPAPMAREVGLAEGRMPADSGGASGKVGSGDLPRYGDSSAGQPVQPKGAQSARQGSSAAPLAAGRGDLTSVGSDSSEEPPRSISASGSSRRSYHNLSGTRAPSSFMSMLRIVPTAQSAEGSPPGAASSSGNTGSTGALHSSDDGRRRPVWTWLQVADWALQHSLRPLLSAQGEGGASTGGGSGANGRSALTRLAALYDSEETSTSVAPISEKNATDGAKSDARSGAPCSKVREA